MLELERPGRECHGWELLAEPGPELEAGAGASDTWTPVQRARSPDLLHPLLYATLTAAQQAGLPVRLLSGRRDVEHQISIWEGRFAAARRNGEPAPATWADAEADFPRWFPWLQAEADGRHGWRKYRKERGFTRRPREGVNPTTGKPWRDAPPLLWPGLSKHQAQPFALAADLEVTDPAANKADTLRKVAELAPQGVTRPIPVVEPWHFAVTRGHY